MYNNTMVFVFCSTIMFYRVLIVLLWALMSHVTYKIELKSKLSWRLNVFIKYLRTTNVFIYADDMYD